jgi:hypothetical protein
LGDEVDRGAWREGSGGRKVVDSNYATEHAFFLGFGFNLLYARCTGVRREHLRHDELKCYPALKHAEAAAGGQDPTDT